MNKTFLFFFFIISFSGIQILAQNMGLPRPAGPFRNSIRKDTFNILDRKTVELKKKLYKTIPALKDFKSTGIVSANYNYGLQQFNPKATKPQGYIIYNGTGSLSYKVVPVNFSFQYTDFKEYYGIPKYFRVSLDTRKLKQNIVDQAAREKKKVQDSLNVTKGAKQKTEQKIAYTKSKLDSAKVSANEKLLNAAKTGVDTLMLQENEFSRKYELLVKDSIQRTIANDSSKLKLNDSLSDVRAKLDKIHAQQKKARGRETTV